MINEYFFCVAELPFSVIMSNDWDTENLLPSFIPFRCKPQSDMKPAFRLEVTAKPFCSDIQGSEKLDDSINDMGQISLLRHADGYIIRISYGNTGFMATHTMTTDRTFSRATAYLHPGDPYIGNVLSSMLRIQYAQAVLPHDGISIHASCVCLQGNAYLFLGKSGTGKSTHARQWLETFSDCILLNDDNPILRLRKDNTLMVYGSPWSGKTPCYRNISCPVAGIVRLQQSLTNNFRSLQGPEAFATLLPSCSAIRQDSLLQDALYTTLINIVQHTSIGYMQCRPDKEAAQVCFKTLSDLRS